MTEGVGIDLVEIDRIAEKINRDIGFRELVFSKNEIEYCEKKTKKHEHYAARFAAKEAFLKALGTGWVSGTAFNEIEITNDENGKPFITLLGLTLATISKLEIKKISVSLTHINSMAAAVVILEK